MRILIATVQVPFVRGGAEVHGENLRDTLQRAGHQAEIVAVPFKWYPPERILDTMLSCRLMDLTESSGVKVDVLIGLKFPAYLIPHPNKVLWILHQHRAAYDLWGHEFGDLHRFPNGSQIREAIEHADRKLIPEARAVFANSGNVAKRLEHYCGLAAQVLYHPPPGAELYHDGEAGDYFFFPSRLNRVKRQDLVLEALQLTRNPVRARFSGVSDEAGYPKELRSLAGKLGVAERVEWLGHITEEAKIAQYAGAIGVLYPTLDEDLGYVTLEAMLARKPIVTCTDSGGPLEFALPGRTGMVPEPTAAAFAEALDALWENRGEARRLGQGGRDYYATLGISWENVVGKLLG